MVIGQFGFCVLHWQEFCFVLSQGDLVRGPCLKAKDLVQGPCLLCGFVQMFVKT